VRRPTDVTQLVGQIAASHQSASHAIAVSAEPTTANVDAAKVERIIENLLLNAVKHTPSGTPIALRLERQGDDLLIIVDDDGPGIPDDFKTSVFEIFDRGPESKSQRPGTGIGLSLVARFAALHGGRAWVEDSSSGGASFRLLLPRCVVTRPPKGAGEQAPHRINVRS
jgi:signal transduction histidine kinase